MQKEFKFREDELMKVLSVIRGKEEKKVSIGKLKNTSTFLNKVEGNSFVGENIYNEDEFYMGDLARLIGEENFGIEIFGTIVDEELVIKDITDEGEGMNITNFVDFSEYGYVYPSGWVMEF